MKDPGTCAAKNSVWVKSRVGEGSQSGRESRGMAGMRWERQAPPGKSGRTSWARQFSR